jgi:hypothetical protein
MVGVRAADYQEGKVIYKFPDLTLSFLKLRQMPQEGAHLLKVKTTSFVDYILYSIQKKKSIRDLKPFQSKAIFVSSTTLCESILQVRYCSRCRRLSPAQCT